MKFVKKILNELVGLRAWSPRVTIGTHATIEFGSPRDETPTWGEYSLWIAGAPWRLQNGNKIISGSGKSQSQQGTIEELNNDVIEKIKSFNEFMDFHIYWRSGKKLMIFNDCDEEETLMIFNKDDVVSFKNGRVEVERSVCRRPYWDLTYPMTDSNVLG